MKPPTRPPQHALFIICHGALDHVSLELVAHRTPSSYPRVYNSGTETLRPSLSKGIPISYCVPRMAALFREAHVSTVDRYDLESDQVSTSNPEKESGKTGPHKTLDSSGRTSYIRLR